MDGNNAFLRVSFAMATYVKLSMASRHHTAIWQRSARTALQMKFISHTKSFVSRVEPCRCFSFALLEYSARDCTKICSIGAQSLALHSLQLNTKYVRELST
ncbi:hypothetical protein EVAR_61232_1 [Eumeta japonica]|uniref:Uncharacterized protein n=1 Tax=Eumeta variegata TaxID=151549 RepID=A0A4C1Z6W4_EUMVA|nr:hypothetical protein EVAR_61232_1 [Eumeta japonica]